MIDAPPRPRPTLRQRMTICVAQALLNAAFPRTTCIVYVDGTGRLTLNAR